MASDSLTPSDHLPSSGNLNLFEHLSASPPSPPYKNTLITSDYSVEDSRTQDSRTQDSRTQTSLVNDLHRATASFDRVNPVVGLVRFGVLGCVVLSLAAIAWTSTYEVVFWGSTVLLGVAYAFWLICTHDMVHHTLTGWTWFDEFFSRLISYPMMWFYGLYAELHRLHHGWNGIDLRDPERVQWTWQDYQQAHPLVQWYVRHQWVVDIFVLGGIGMILKTLFHALQFQSLVPRIRRQLLIDVLGMVLVQGTIVTVAVLHGQGWRYLFFWLVLERVIGAMMQTRDHLEHYALWGNASGYQLTQLYACRNLKVSPLIGWLMGGLNYHAVHHAFPGIPFNQLSEAFQRIQTVLHQHDLPLMNVDRGYIQETIYFSQHPSLIGDANPTDATRRNSMISI